ncbi:B12-binding domain-containing radical SAM protein [Marinifilum flexuosum]|uniref:Radical SAM superfamily enzyme YgiQ (UPF0313 family) n=1 Tax=Marinifilum flexuosum TaxID=1117708 RepID=A0A419X4B3_9BACT|nr:radical SAM protein [Marinifilum flexuosum]RKE02450.1 radical SAM superfamily enzyme YgiQ (UPF0313 family) [Marinifilum flexuosum]
MKVLLINPPYSAYSPKESAIPPLGLARIASTIRKKANVQVLDMACKEVLGKDPWGELLHTINLLKPNIIGIGPLVTSNVNKGLRIAKIIKSILPESKVTLGGPDPTFTYNKLLQNTNVDTVFIGESEKSFLAYVQSYNDASLLKNINGIAFKLKGKIISNGRNYLTNKEFDSLPMPAWDLFPIEEYSEIAKKNNFEPYLPLESSRGCPLDCIFCSCTNIFSSKIRLRTSQSIVNEITHNINKYHIKRYVFNDDNVGIHINHLLAIADKIIKSQLDEVKFAISSTLDSKLFSDLNHLLKIKAAGFDEIFMGCETIHEDAIKKVRKTSNPNLWAKNIKNAVELCRRAGIASRTNWIIGLPTDTKDKLLQTIEFIKELKPDTALMSLLQSYPGTYIDHEINKDENKIGIHKLTENPSDVVASKFDPTLYTQWLSSDEMIEIAYKFIYTLSPYFEANISGSPYYIFELWREQNN